MMVNVGITSVPGKISSTKLKILPAFPFFIPKVKRNIMADKGAQNTSVNSPKIGIIKLPDPIKSITIQKINGGCFSLVYTGIIN